MTQGSFAERARQQQRRNGPACQMGTVLGKMPPEYVTEVNAALADLTINGTTIARLLTDDGYKVGADTVRRHRNNVCECGK